MLDDLMEQWLSLRQVQLIIKNRKRALKNKKDISVLQKRIETTENTNLQDIKWVGPATIQKLLNEWIKSQDDIKATWFDRIKEIIKSPISLKAIKTIFSK